MENSYKAKPASHNIANFKDKASITLVENILASTQKAISDLNAIDKWPNIDGYIELQNSNQDLLGKLEAQVKTLPENHKYKFPLETSFIAYCNKVAILPVILFGVDKITKKAYWLHINQNFIKSLDNWESQETKTISFSPEQYIAETDFNICIQKWEQLILDYKLKFQKYDELKPQYEAILAYSNPALGKENIDFMNIHQFLDEYNRLLDGPFNRIKQIFYPKSWKVGFAYHTYSADETAYRCYPIPPNFNDIQIKNVDKQYTLTSRSPNPIEKDPVHHARGEIRFDTFRNILHYKYLDHTGNEFFAHEFIISIIDKFKTLTGLETKSEYTLDEINNLKERIQQRDLEVNKISFYIDNFPDSIFPIFEEMVSFIKEQNILTIRRVYNNPIKDNSEQNLKILFENLLPAYNQIIKNNFPLLAKELSLFIDSSDTIIITKFANTQQYNMIYLKSVDKTKEPSVEVVINKEEQKIFSNSINKVTNHIFYKNNQYEIIDTHLVNRTLIEKDFPMLLYIYAILIARFDNYFVELGFENQRGWYYHNDKNPYLFCQ